MININGCRTEKMVIPIRTHMGEFYPVYIFYIYCDLEPSSNVQMCRILVVMYVKV
jgi:hypothetical protein